MQQYAYAARITTLRFAALQLHCVSRCKTYSGSTKVGRRASPRRIAVRRAHGNNCGGGRLARNRRRDTCRSAGLPRALRDGRATPSFRARSRKSSSSMLPTPRRCWLGATAISSSSASSATVRNREKPMASPLSGSRARISDTPAIGRIPPHLRARPRLAEAVAERRVHDPHHRVEVAATCRARCAPAARPGRHQAASGTRASGARA